MGHYGNNHLCSFPARRRITIFCSSTVAKKRCPECDNIYNITARRKISNVEIINVFMQYVVNSCLINQKQKLEYALDS